MATPAALGEYGCPRIGAGNRHRMTDGLITTPRKLVPGSTLIPMTMAREFL